MKLISNLSTREESSDTGTTDYYVLGSGPVGVAVARRLHAAGHAVTVVGETHDPTDLPTVRGNPSDVGTLADAGITEASTVVVTVPRDARSLLVAQLVRTRFGVSDVRLLVYDPDRYDLVADVGHEPICVTTALSDAVVDDLEMPSHLA